MSPHESVPGLGRAHACSSLWPGQWPGCQASRGPSVASDPRPATLRTGNPGSSAPPAPAGPRHPAPAQTGGLPQPPRRHGHPYPPRVQAFLSGLIPHTPWPTEPRPRHCDVAPRPGTLGAERGGFWGPGTRLEGCAAAADAVGAGVTHVPSELTAPARGPLPDPEGPAPAPRRPRPPRGRSGGLPTWAASWPVSGAHGSRARPCPP